LNIEEEVTADAIAVEASNWENFVMVMAYIADCHTFKEEYHQDNFRVVHTRNRFVDYMLSFLQFQ